MIPTIPEEREGGGGDMFGLKTGTNNCISVSLSERCLDIEGRWSRN